ncbi:hypothetical protein [Micromonospora sp. I033]
MSQSGATGREPDLTGERPVHRGGEQSEPDVLLDIPEVTVDQIRLSVQGLDADLSLRARLANLLQLDAGVRVHLEGVELDVTGVSAEALLKVRLEKLVQILDRALTTIDRNPHLIEALARSAGGSIDDVNRATQQLASAPVLDASGQRIGTVGAVADRALREGVGQPAPPSPATPTGARAPGRTGEPGKAGEPGKPAPGGKPEEAEKGPGGPPGPAQLAGQAGETLLQAGRSVWEAIQSGMGQHRPKR